MNSIRPADFVLRPATAFDAAAIATIMRASLNSLDWMPVLHTPEEDLLFIRNVILPRQQVTVAEAGEHIVGFIAVRSDWVEQLYLDPVWTGRGVGSRLIDARDDSTNASGFVPKPSATGRPMRKACRTFSTSAPIEYMRRVIADGG